MLSVKRVANTSEADVIEYICQDGSATVGQLTARPSADNGLHVVSLETKVREAARVLVAKIERDAAANAIGYILIQCANEQQKGLFLTNGYVETAPDSLTIRKELSLRR